MKFCGKDPCECEPVAPMTFEERLETELNETFNTKSPFIRFPQEHDKKVAAAFARWSREETIKEVLGLLRSSGRDRAIDPCRNCMGIDLADWLETKLKEPTVVMKDPIYRIPDDEL